jgi:glutaconate CoA-transferase subunit B
MEKVDFVCGVGWTKERREGKIKFGGVTKVFSNLGVFDFDTKKTGRMRLLSYHTGVTIDQIQENTSFELIIPKECKETDPPSEEELMLMREVCDPGGIRRMDLGSKEEYARIMQELTDGTTYEMIYGK